MKQLTQHQKEPQGFNQWFSIPSAPGRLQCRSVLLANGCTRPHRFGGPGRLIVLPGFIVGQLRGVLPKHRFAVRQR